MCARHTGRPSSESDGGREEEEEEGGGPAGCGPAAAVAASTLRPLLATLKMGADLTRLRLPAALLEPRSLLERYSELWARPDSFVR